MKNIQEKKISELIVNDILKSIMNFNRKNIAIIGLGYVGLPLALAFSKYFDVIGFDKNVQRVKELKKGIDVTGEIESKNLTQLKKIKITNNNKEIKKCNIFIVTVPTPINKAKDPDLSYLADASTIISKVLKRMILLYMSQLFFQEQQKPFVYQFLKNILI